MTEGEREKHRIYMKQYYETHSGAREKKRESDRAYAAEHREYACDKAKAYYWNNREEVRRKTAEKRRLAKKQVAELLGGVCMRCEFAHLAALDFHHRDPALKLFRISDAVMRSKKYPWETIVAEVLKCDLLCKNCHAIEHCTWE